MISHFPLSVLVACAAMIWALILSGLGWVIPPSFFRPLSIVAGSLSLSLLVFDGWVWAWPGIRRLVNRPDIRGTWEGVIRSSWKYPDGNGLNLGSINAYVVVHQTYTGLRLRLLTRESQSSSITAALISEPDGTTVFALYRNEPKALLRSRSPIHHGGLILRVGGPPPSVMDGEYWTNRQTIGEVELRRISKRRVHDYGSAAKLEVSGG
jgi:hypothetical protein